MLAMICGSNVLQSCLAILAGFVFWLSWLPLMAMLAMLDGCVGFSACLC